MKEEFDKDRKNLSKIEKDLAKFMMQFSEFKNIRRFQQSKF